MIDGPNAATPAGAAFSPFAAARRTILIGSAFALLGALLYGINIPAARVASQAGLPGADLIFWRALILVPVIALWALASGTSLALPPVWRGATLRLALAGSLTAVCYLSALDHLPVPFAVVIFYTFPLIVMALSSRLEGTGISRLQLGCFAAAFIGLMLAVGPSLGGLSLLGMLLAFAGALCCAGMFILAGRVGDAPLRVAFWMQIVSLPVAFLFALINGGPRGFGAFAAAPLAIALAMGCYAIAFIFQMMASARISPGRTSLLFLFEPVTAIAIAWIVLGERLSGLQIGGLLLILAALAAEILVGTPKAEENNART